MTAAPDLATTFALRGNPAEWSDRWLCARRCAQLHDPRKSRWRTYVEHAWKNRQLDKLRAFMRDRLRFPGRVEPLAHQRGTADPRETPDWLTREQMCLMQRIASGVPYKVIAEQDGVPVGTVKSRVNRVRALVGRNAKP